ncbi:MAG TPA: hypothetical protein VFF58_00710 [Candidatus Nitrosotalea sp.]|nr:hypothetical protein [Candidatus Nitrosotalea sp.]
MTKHILFATALLLAATFASAQVTVAIAPDPHPQFLNASGQVLANGFLYTYQAGTNTLLSTYVDSTGTTQNPDPIPLDATGAPSNGSVQTGIWLANTAYKFCAYNAALVQQWCTDNVTGYLNLLNLANTWTFQQTFTLPIIDTATDNQLVFGSPGNQTFVDWPPPTGNVTVHGPNISDTLVARTTTDTLTNKTLNLPVFNGGTCAIVNGPGTYTCIANSNPTGTQLNGLVKLTNAPSQGIWTGITDTGGAVGICVAGCGNTGTATIQQSGGPVTCSFDGSVTAGDYVQISPSLGNGACHDAGASYPVTGQVLGRTLSTATGVNNYPMMLFGPEITASVPVRILCIDPTATTVNANTTAQQVIKTCKFPAGTLGVVNKGFRMTIGMTITPGGAGPPTSAGGIGWGPSTALGTANNPVIAQGANASAYSGVAIFTCAVSALGVSGTASCSQTATVSGAGAPTSTTNRQSITLNTTADFYVGEQCSFSAGSVSNTCLSDLLTVEQLN